MDFKDAGLCCGWSRGGSGSVCGSGGPGPAAAELWIAARAIFVFAGGYRAGRRGGLELVATPLARAAKLAGLVVRPVLERQSLRALVRIRGTALRDPALLAIERRLSVGRLRSYISAVGEHVTRVRRVSEVALQQFIANARDNPAVSQRKQYFHPMIQIARHQVGTAQVNFLVAAVTKIIDPAVFQKPTHDAGDFDIFADPGQPGRSEQMPRTSN